MKKPKSDTFETSLYGNMPLNKKKGGLPSRLFIWLLVVLLPLLRSEQTVDPDLHLKYIALGLLLTACMAYFFLTGKQQLNYQVLKQPLLMACFAALLCTLYALFISDNSADARFDAYRTFYTTVLIIVLVFMDVTLLQEELPRAFTFLNLVLLIAGLRDLVGLLKTGTITVPEDTYAIQGMFEHRNLYAQLLFFSFPFTLYGSLSLTGFWKQLARVCFAVSLFMLLILSNRATWLALLSGFILLVPTFIGYVRKNGQTTQIMALGKTLRLPVLGAVLLTLVFFAVFFETKTINKHAANIVNFEKGSTKDRMVLWKNTLALIREKPITGHGLASWKIKVLECGNTGLASEDNITFYQTPHNDFLWVATEQGLIGLAVYLSIFLLCFFYLIKTLKSASDIRQFLFCFSLLFMFAGYTVYAFFSFPRERIESCIMFALVPGLCLALYFKNSGLLFWRPGKRNYFLFILPLLVIYGLRIGIVRFRGEVHLAKAMQAKANGDNQKIIHEIEKASSPFYQIDPVSTPLAWYSGSALFNLGNYTEALKAYEEAVRITPCHIHVLNNLASCYEMLGKHELALEYYNKALTLAPNFEEAWLNSCAIYFNQRRFKEAYTALGHINSETKNPQYLTFLSTVMKTLVEEQIQQHPNSAFSAEYRQHKEDKGWLLKIHKELLKNGKDIDSFFVR